MAPVLRSSRRQTTVAEIEEEIQETKTEDREKNHIKVPDNHSNNNGSDDIHSSL